MSTCIWSPVHSYTRVYRTPTIMQQAINFSTCFLCQTACALFNYTPKLQPTMMIIRKLNRKIRHRRSRKKKQRTVTTRTFQLAFDADERKKKRTHTNHTKWINAAGRNRVTSKCEWVRVERHIMQASIRIIIMVALTSESRIKIHQFREMTSIISVIPLTFY